MMEYCPQNQSLSVSTYHLRGLSPCLTNTITSTVVAGIAVIGCVIQGSLYAKYSTVTDRYTRLKSKLYRLHMLLQALLVLAPLAFLFTRVYELQSGAYYGYQVLRAILSVLTWVLSIVLVSLERRRQLPVSPSRGHGVSLILIWTFSFVAVNVPFVNWYGLDWWWKWESDSDRLQFGMWLAEYIVVFLVFVIGLRAPALEVPDYTRMEHDSENAANTPRTTWAGLFGKLKIIAPMVWPKRNIWLQLCVILCAGILVVGRIVNLYVPLYYKKIVDEVPTRFCWDIILVWVALRWLQGSGGSGVLANLRSFLWIKVQQYTTKEAELNLFGHLHGLSLRWHLSKKTGEVLKVMSRGTSSVNNILYYVVFSIMPTIADIIIAIVYFVAAFDIYFGLIVFTTMLLYLIGTIIVTEWRTKYRRSMNLLDNAKNSRAVDSLINFETVKYYGNADFEVNTYGQAIIKYQSAEWLSTASLNVLSMVQNVIITSGLIGGSFLCAWYIHDGGQIQHRQVTVGDFVLFCTYVVQLYGPLNYFGTYYRMIQAAFIDMENMFELLDETQEVKDIPKAPALAIKSGYVEFKDAHFHYHPEKPVLRGISFKVPPGETYALVGPSGAGKSSIIRLLFRFYDLTSGQILIDGQNIAHVKQETLRKAIGIVPQDTVLFNTDIKYNIAYGNTEAGDDEIFAAATSADIHDKILSFPEAYETVVGERGLKLSGGEKQRVAIARTLLKNPKVILLDEATSALDTHTERNILRSFEKVCANRTTIVVAHRLSTIIHAHRILVLDDGIIKEHGTHEELLARGEIYHSMWMDQQRKRDKPTTDSQSPDDGESGISQSESSGESSGIVANKSNTVDT